MLPTRLAAVRTVVPAVAPALALLMVAIAVRLVRLDSDPLWIDEAATIGIARMDWAVILGPMAAAESSPPGFYLLAKLWMLAFGEDIVVLRLLTVLAGVASLLPVWLLARAAHGRRAAWIAAGFVALAATHVRLSQDGRCYTVLFLTTCWAAVLGMAIANAIRNERKVLWPAAGYGLLLGAMLWLHATAALIGLSLNAMVIAALLPGWRQFRRGIVVLLAANLLAVLVASGPLLAMFHHIVGQALYVDRWLPPPTVLGTAHLYGTTLVAPFLDDLSLLALLLQTVLLAVAAVLWWRSRNPVLFAMAAMLLVGDVAMPLASLIRPVLMDRTVLFLLLPLAVLLAAGTASLPRAVFLPVAVVLLGLQAYGTYGWHSLETRKERWDSAAEYLLKSMQPGEPIVVTEGAFAEISLAAHFRLLGAAPPRMILVPPRSAMEQLAARQLAPGRVRTADQLCGELAGHGDTLWLVMRDLPSVVDDDRGFTTQSVVHALLVARGATRLAHEATTGVAMERWRLPGC